MAFKHKFIVLTLFLASQVLSAQEQFSVYFETNKSVLNSNEITLLEQWISKNPKVKIVALNGFTDKDGASELNDSLAQKRVDFIYNRIFNTIAIRSDFKTINFGEKHIQKLDKAKNRRVDIFYLLEKDILRENEILGISEIIVVQKPKLEIRYPDTFQVQNPNGTISEFTLDVDFMQKVNKAIPGEKLQIENLNFQFNTFAVTNESRGKLYELLLVLMKNPKLKIEIQGHICCNSSAKESLSTQRAKAVKEFLKSQGIESNRVTYQGFGSSQPLFALPEKNENERAANRRVEILIIENQ